jgi:DNA-binding NarL/FixJ family response regulator
MVALMSDAPRRIYEPPRLLVIDDEPELLDLLQAWFEHSGYTLFTASDGFTALEIARTCTLDVIVTDLKMPGMSGMHVLSLVKEIDPNIEVIILSGQGTMQDAIEALREGRAFDFLQKPVKNLTDLNVVIEKAVSRKRKFAERQSGQALKQRPVDVEELSAREIEIVSAVAQGMNNRAIAAMLSVSEKTVKNHLTRIYEKLRVKNRTQAVVLTQQMGWL